MRRFLILDSFFRNDPALRPSPSGAVTNFISAFSFQLSGFLFIPLFGVPIKPCALPPSNLNNIQCPYIHVTGLPLA